MRSDKLPGVGATTAKRDRDPIATMKRKLRDLRRLELRFRGIEDDSDRLVWDDYFAIEPGVRAQYPIVTLSVLDRESRKRVLSEYLIDVFAATMDETGAPGAPRRRELLRNLGLTEGSSDEEIRKRFRLRAKELHPDLGGDADAMAELLRLYADGPSSLT